MRIKSFSTSLKNPCRKVAVASLMAMTGLFGFAGMALAADVSDAMHVQLTVEPECMIDAGDTALSATGIVASSGGGLGVNAFCNMGTAYTVGVDRGLNDGANTNQPTDRAVLATDASGNTVPYKLFSDLAMTQPIDGIDSGNVYSGVGNGEWQELPFSILFDRVSYAPNGVYGDDLTWTLRY